jgi:hypothetical protein
MRIILIHGQGRTPLAMSLLGWRLNRQRYKIHYFGYATPTETFEAITQRLVRFIGRKIGPRPYAIVAHSLGGIITRASLPYLDNNPPRHLVMLAPPNQPALIAKKARANALYRLVTRDCGRKLSDEAFYQTLPLPTVPTTIIADYPCRPFRPRLLPELKGCRAGSRPLVNRQMIPSYPCRKPGWGTDMR